MPGAAFFGARITGVGHAVPERVVTNHDLAKIVDTNDEWIVARTGMRERRYVSDGEASSDLATVAARAALERAGLRADEIDCYLVATVTPDYPFPATACILAANLGAAGKAAFDLQNACSGFVYGLPLAASLVRSGIFARTMIVGVDTLSRVTNQTDRGTSILFGDGAGAAIVERTPLAGDCFLAAELGADGTSPELLYIPGGGSRTPLTPDGIERRLDKIVMDGRGIYRSAVTKMVESSKIALERAGLASGDVDWLIPHQANARIIEAAAKRLDVPEERIVLNVDRYGNTSAASIPIALSETVERDVLRDGDVLLFTAFGGGLSWGAVAWRWSA